MQSDLIDLDVACKRYRFLVDENRWQQLIQERLSTWEDSTTIRFEYNADYGINDETIDVLMEKLEATNRERVELLGEANQTRTTENLRKNEVYKLFTKIEDTVNITFFSKDEYKIANRKWVRRNWGSLHVHAYLKMIGLAHCCQVFKEKSVEGHALLELGTPEILIQTFWMSSQDATTLAACINDLGDLDSISILAEVSNEVESIRSGGDSSQKTESLTDSIAAFFGVKNQTEFSGTHTSGQDGIFSRNIDKYRYNRKEQVPPSDCQESVVNLAADIGDKQKNRLIEQGPLVGNVSIVVPSSNKDMETSETWNDFDQQSQYCSSDSNESDESFDSSNYNPKSSVANSLYGKNRSNQVRGKIGKKKSIYSNYTGNVDNCHRESGRSRASSFGEIGDHDSRPGSDTVAGGVTHTVDSSFGGQSDGTSLIGEKQQAYLMKGYEETDSDRRSNSMGESDYSGSSSGCSRGFESSVSRSRHNHERRKSKSKRGRRKKGRSRRIREEVSGDDNEDEEMAYKVVMVGVVGVGKKSLMKRFGGAEFSSSEISKMSKHFISNDVERFVIKTWDDKGHEVREKLVENRRSILPFTRKADILMVVYDITNVLSFKYLPDILEQIISSGTTPWMSLVLVGNKIDLDWEDGARQVSSDMAFDLCRRYGFGLNFETSAKTGSNVTELLSVALSRCEQDRIRELNNTLKNGEFDVKDGRNAIEQPTFAQNIASFFGMGAGVSRETNQTPGDVNSTRVGPRSDIVSILDDDNTQYSSRFGPVSSYSNYAGILSVH